MDELDDLYGKLQVYLMKKDDECGRLRFLTSRTTSENFANVLEICDTIAEITKACGIPIENEASADDPRCVQTYKYLLLNTNFDSQESLAEDALHGHLVDMCPPLSPYLLIEVLWLLRYEEIVARSILHVPLDLAVEIIEISKRCILFLDFPRGLDFLFSLTLSSYKKLRFIAQHGAITTKLTESLERLMIYCQDLMSLYLNERFTRINEVSGIEKSERHGLIMRMMIKLARECLDCAKKGVYLSKEEATMYKLTFGREPYRHTNDSFAVQLNMLDQEFVHNLLKKGTDLDVRTYLDWASLEDSINPKISFQKSFGIECYKFIEFIKSHKNLIILDNLVECLQQISSKPDDADLSVNIEEVQKSLLEGETQCLKSLMKCYCEWSHETFNVVRKYHASMDKEDFFNLLEYLTYIMAKEGQEEHKREVYTTVTQVLMQQDIKHVYEIVVDYILKHNAHNTLESPHTEEAFKNFMLHNKNFKSSTNLRLLLFFLMKNPRKFLALLVEMSIGHPEYKNIMITPSDFMLLSPILSIRENEQDSLVISALRAVCVEDDEWDSKKFLHLVKVMLDEYILSVDDLVNKVFIPYLEESDGGSENFICVLNCLRIILPKCTKETNFEELFAMMAIKMSSIRSKKRLRKSWISQALALITRVINLFAESRLKDLSANAKLELMEKIERSLKPIDKQQAARFLFLETPQRSNIFDTMIRDYEVRCAVVLAKITDTCRAVGNPAGQNPNFRSNEFQDHFIRHFILTSVESEYVQLACESTIFLWEFLRCENEYLAYEKFVRFTIDVCLFCLEFPQDNSPDAFPWLLKKLVQFTSKFLNLQNVCLQKIDQGLMENFRELDKSINQTIFSSLYANVVLEINNRDPREPVHENLQSLLNTMQNFAHKCEEVSHAGVQFEGRPSFESESFKLAFDLIQQVTSGCYINDNYSGWSKIHQQLLHNETNH